MIIRTNLDAPDIFIEVQTGPLGFEIKQGTSLAIQCFFNLRYNI